MKKEWGEYTVGGTLSKNWVLYFHANKQALSLTYSNWMGSTAVVPHHCHQINWNGHHCYYSSWSRAADAGRAAVVTFKKQKNCHPQLKLDTRLDINENRSLYPLVFARVLTKWKHILGNAAWGSPIDARHVLSRLWWIKKLNECGRENEIDHLIFSFADLLWQERYVTLPAAAARYNSNKVMCNLEQEYSGFASMMSESQWLDRADHQPKSSILDDLGTIDSTSHTLHL